MKILHIITNTELGGAQKVCIDLCTKAVEFGHEVAVTSMAGGYLWEQLPAQVKQYQLKNMVKPIRPISDLKVLKELKAVKKDFNPDIIQLHSSKAGVLGRVIGLGMSNRVVYTVHGFDSIRLKHRIFLPLERILQKKCGGIVAVSNYDKQNLINEKITRNVQTIYNGIGESVVSESITLPDCCKNKKVIMTIARIAAPKRFDLFLNVAKQFDANEYEFVWIGGDPNHSVEELHQLYNIPENVFLMGNVLNASKFLPLCDCFVLFSDFEGLPMTIIEAMSQKKPIVASNVGGISELVDDYNGKLIQNNVEEAVDAIKYVLEKNIDNQIGQKSYARYRYNFTLDRMWKLYEDLYKILLK